MRDSLHERLTHIHRAMRHSTLLATFTATTRVLLAIGFLPSGLTKVLGNRFTTLGTDTPVGDFFEAFYQTGGWYRLVGAAQLLAAGLLLIPRVAHIGAFLFLPIIFNIWAITVAVGFRGTWVITSLMLLANGWLVAWEYDRVASLLAIRASSAPRTSPPYVPLIGLGAVGCGGFYALLVQGGVARLDAFPGWLGIIPALLLGALGGATATWYARRT